MPDEDAVSQIDRMVNQLIRKLAEDGVIDIDPDEVDDLSVEWPELRGEPRLEPVENQLDEIEQTMKENLTD